LVVQVTEPLLEDDCRLVEYKGVQVFEQESIDPAWLDG
jgi:hypothetical protein